ncbi:UNVERIFIED_CONTAM: hypothetical protein PYX00_007395 [Menopon gallinae]|uniref:Rab11 family-interacting protein 1 n=1 Tax=Menopon gallinae TaxID=328185 RepID=A0AAW2HJD6_9NEOP
MWNPTHVQVTIQRAKNLLIKGKNGTNNAFVTIAVGKEKYQTSVKEKVGEETVTWQEQCELLIPKVGNTANIVLTALHRNSLGIDEFLGTVSIPLSSFDVYDRPKSRWYKLEGKPGKEKGKDKERGELEVRISFTVKASGGSMMDLSKKEKHKTSLGHISNIVSGSLLSLGSSDKKSGIKQIAKSISKKVSRKKRDSNGGDGASETGNKSSFRNVDPGVISEDEDEFTFDNLSHKSSGNSLNSSSALENLAGGEFLRRSTKGPPMKPPRVNAITTPTVTPEKPVDEWEQKLFGKGDTLKRFSHDQFKLPPSDSSPALLTHAEKLSRNNSMQSATKEEKLSRNNSIHSPVKEVKNDPIPDVKEPEKPQETPPPVTERKSLTSQFNAKQEAEQETKESKFAKKLKQLQTKMQERKEYDRFIVGQESVSKPPEVSSKHTKDVLEKFESKSRDDLIDMVIELQKNVDHSKVQLKELEDYLDQLLLKVMETTPRILQNPYISCKTQANFNYN